MADKWIITYQNLIDVGCSEDFIECFMQLNEEEKERQSIALLSKHRRTLLDCCHAEQKKIDCLDYLLYQMVKKSK